MRNYSIRKDVADKINDIVTEKMKVIDGYYGRKEKFELGSIECSELVRPAAEELNKLIEISLEGMTLNGQKYIAYVTEFGLPRTCNNCFYKPIKNENPDDCAVADKTPHKLFGIEGNMPKQIDGLEVGIFCPCYSDLLPDSFE